MKYMHFTPLIRRKIDKLVIRWNSVHYELSDKAGFEEGTLIHRAPTNTKHINVLTKGASG